MAISVTEPISLAYTRTKKMCFQPFDITKWFLLGFCLWLSTLGQGAGGGFNQVFNYSKRGSGGRSSPPQFQQVLSDLLTWCQDHLALVITLAVVILLLGAVIGTIILWVRSRAHFMFLDGVVHNRGLITQPWKEFAKEGNSYFKISILVQVLGLLLVLVMLLLSLALFNGPIFHHEALTGLHIIAIILMGLFYLAVSLVFVFVMLCLHAFVVPIMYKRRVGAKAGWLIFYREILAGHWGTILLFGLMSWLLGMLSVILIIALGCLTCCVGFVVMVIPYLGTVLLLPVGVFFKSYTVYFMEQFGPDFQLFYDQLATPVSGFPIVMNNPLPPDNSQWPPAQP